MRTLGLAALLALLAGPAGAHPDHVNHPVASLSHLVTDPFHLSLLAVGAVLAFAAARALQRTLR